MTTKPLANNLAAYLRSARTENKLSYGQLSALTGLTKSGLFALENGDRTQPEISTLTKLATALQVPLADLFSAAGYEQPTTLPTVQPYLRSKYKHLPPEARAEIADAFERISAKYGIDPNALGPQPGQDE